MSATKQRPTITNAEMLKLAQTERAWGYGASPLTRVNPIVRERVLPGETKAQAKARWAREQEIEQWRDADEAQSCDGRRMPVRYDDAGE